MSEKDRCSTCDFYNIVLGLCQLPNLAGPGVAKKGTDYCPSWKPYKKSNGCSGDCDGDCDGCDDCSCGSKDSDLSTDDLCGGHCGGCNSSCSGDDSDPADNYWPLYGTDPLYDSDND